MSTLYRQFIDASSNSRVIGACSSFSDGSVAFTVNCSCERAISMNFSLPRSNEIGRGTSLKSVNLVYNVTGETLSNITLTLKQIIVSNNFSVVENIISLNPTSFVLINNSWAIINNIITRLTNPTINNNAESTSTYYYLEVKFIPTSTESQSLIRFYGIDLEYSLTTGISSTATTSTGSGFIPSTSSFHEITTTGVGDVITLANGTPGQHLYVVYKEEAALNNTATISLSSGVGGNNVTFTKRGDTAHLMYGTGGWYFISGTATFS